MTEEKIKAQWGDRCLDSHEDCPCCQMWGMFDTIEALTDKIECLESDMDRLISDVAFGKDPSKYLRFSNNLRDLDRNAGKAALTALKLHSEYEDINKNDEKHSVAWERFVRAKHYALSLHEGTS